MTPPDFLHLSVPVLLHDLKIGTNEREYRLVELALRDAYAAGRRDALEEAAKVPLQHLHCYPDFGCPVIIAEEIRALGDGQ